MPYKIKEKKFSRKNIRSNSVNLFLLVLPIVIFIFSMFIGRYVISPILVIKILLSKIIYIDPTWHPTMESVIWDVRLPRAVAAMLVGAGLSVSGASFQGLFKNPLVSPQILGVSAGAGFGAALALLLLDKLILVQISAFIGGVVAVAFTYKISKIYKTTPLLMLVLSGMVTAALFSALTSLIKYVADPLNKLPAVVFWLMGSFNAVSRGDLVFLGPFIIVGSAVLVLIRWRINVLSLGEEEARSMGINTEQLKFIIISSATIITAASVCMSGIIGWVGLVIPHVGRILVGPDHKKLIPVSLILGASYLLIVDDIARSAISTEIPIGILTAIIGAPFFAYLIRKSKSGWNY
ncbi:MAG: iron ABC transporter permease [Candidatus Methanofastidiosa archaeon]|jgi:iron complex transport system permease protein|nr:iron ABC transporter permease [Candidatus Methanofastidiosa archaeon]HOM96262.1 iron ABC transporter permease [Methanofastidiosum sp.]HPC81212.1 iron ABC transporter permease [Methanofastidiosum sp.]HRS26350.1 iron ABC transporter permease [Methanofastidiosum sp.]